MSGSSDDAILAGLRVLVVDDTPLYREMVSLLLADAGAVVQVASDGAEAVELALAADPPFDLVLMDIQMPGMDGCEASRRLRAQPKTAGMPIVAMTAGWAASDRQACMAAGINGYVAKPLEFGTLVQTVRHMSRARPSGHRASARC